MSAVVDEFGDVSQPLIDGAVVSVGAGKTKHIMLLLAEQLQLCFVALDPFVVENYHGLPIFGNCGGSMAKNTSISLGDHFDTFIAQQLQSGRYGSASEVIRAALRMLEQSETKLERLRRKLEEGEQSAFEEYSYDALITELDDESH